MQRADINRGKAEPLLTGPEIGCQTGGCPSGAALSGSSLKGWQEQHQHGAVMCWEHPWAQGSVGPVPVLGQWQPTSTSLSLLQ